jgi:hypothetical protein
MQVNKISQANTPFSGDIVIYVPKNISPNLETFHRLLIKENVQSLIKEQPFDLFVKENNKGKIDVLLKSTKEEKINPFILIFLEEKISKIKDKMLMDEISEQFKNLEKEALEKIEIKEPAQPKIKMFIPDKIGRNSELNNKPKSNSKFIKRR